jgi:hypothetical protein
VSICTALLTVFFGLLALAFGTFLLYNTLSGPCILDIQNGLEGDTELKITVCELQNQERNDFSGIWYWYVINAWVIVGTVLIATIISGVSLMVIISDKETLPKDCPKPFSSSNSSYTKDSGSENENMFEIQSLPNITSRKNINTSSVKQQKRGTFFDNLN